MWHCRLHEELGQQWKHGLPIWASKPLGDTLRLPRQRDMLLIWLLLLSSWTCARC